MPTERISPPNARRSFRERRLAANRSILDLQRACGIHRARLSLIERGMMPTLAEHQAIEAALREWEAEARS